MIKKLLIVALFALPFGVSAQGQLKFGTVNSQEIITVMPEKLDAEKKFAEASKKYEDEYLKIQEELNRKYQEYITQRDSMPASINDRRMQEVQTMEERRQTFLESSQQQLQAEQQRLLAPVQQKFIEAVKAVGAENNFTYIFDQGGSGILYTGAANVDVTGLVKTKLNLK